MQETGNERHLVIDILVETLKKKGMCSLLLIPDDCWYPSNIGSPRVYAVTCALYLSGTKSFSMKRRTCWYIFFINLQAASWKVENSTSLLFYVYWKEISFITCLLSANAQILTRPSWDFLTHQANGHPLMGMGFFFLQERKVQFQEMSSIWLYI